MAFYDFSFRYLRIVVMETFDYYKLLGIPVGSTIGDLRKAFLLKLDEIGLEGTKNESTVIRYIEVITNGLEMLSNPEKKKVYDILLLSKLIRDEGSDINKDFYRKYGKSKRNPLHSSKFENEESFIISESEIENVGMYKKITHYKVILFIVVVCNFLFFFDRIFWMRYSEYRMLSVVFIALCYLLFTLWIVIQVNMYFEVRNHIRFKPKYREKFIVSVILLIMFSLPLVLVKVQHIRRNYHLSHFGTIVQPKQIMLDDEWFTAEFETPDGIYVQSINLGDRSELFKQKLYFQGKFQVKYSARNPRIIDIEAR
jgi:hypothetical protein